MSVTLVLSCGGCDAKTEGTGPLVQKFTSFSGRDHGFGTTRITSVLDLIPEGWVAFDPYTYCCYCPACWTSIQSGTGTTPSTCPMG